MSVTDKKDAASKGLKKEGSEEQALATSLSAGEKQMLNLARAMLLPNIRILVCDEPTSNVDMATDRRLQQVAVKSCVCVYACVRACVCVCVCEG